MASTHTNLALTLLAEDKLSAADGHAAKVLIYRNVILLPAPITLALAVATRRYVSTSMITGRR